MLALTSFQKDIKAFYQSIYRPMLLKISGGPVTPNTRYPDRKAAEAEAWECAKLHAGLLPRNKVFEIVDDVQLDPWKSWRGNPNSPNPNDRAKSAVSTFVVRTTREVYDHRNRYFIPQPWAKQLGFVNAAWAERLSPDW